MSRTLLRLALAVVVVVLAVWLVARRAPESDGLALGPVLPGLSERVNAVEQVAVHVAGGATATLVREDAGWVVRERHDWPADTGKLRDYLLRLGAAQRIEAKTQRAESYPRLGVEDIDAADAKSVRVDIVGGGDPLALIIGQNNPQGHGSYVRIPGQAQSWLADLDIAPERVVENWLSRDLIDVDPRRVVRIRVELAGEAPFTLSRTAVEDSHWQLAPIPAKRDTAQAPAEAIAGFLQGLRLDDVAPADAVPEDAERIQFDSADGLSVTVRLWQHDGKSWASLAAAFDEAAATAFVGAQIAREAQAAEQKTTVPEGEEAGKESSEAAHTTVAGTGGVEERVTKLREQAEAAAARFDGWIFAMSPYKMDNARKTHADYISESK